MVVWFVMNEKKGGNSVVGGLNNGQAYAEVYANRNLMAFG